MKFKLHKIPIVPAAFMLCGINTVIGFVVGAIMSVSYLATGDDQVAMGMGGWAILLLSVLNMVMGFAGGAFFAWLYNFLTKFFGGLQLEFEPQEN